MYDRCELYHFYFYTDRLNENEWIKKEIIMLLYTCTKEIYSVTQKMNNKVRRKKIKKQHVEEKKQNSTMEMPIDLISCSHFLVATVFVHTCRDIWRLSVECQQNIAQLVVKTCRNYECGETRIFTAVLTRCSPCIFPQNPVVSNALDVYWIISTLIIKTDIMNCLLHVQVQT